MHPAEHHVPFVIAAPSVPLCAGFFLLFILRYPLTENRRDLRVALVALASLLSGMLCMYLANLEGRWIPWRYDLYVYRIDRGFEPGFALGRLLLTHTWGLWAVNFFYGLLGAAVMALLIAYAWKPERDMWQVIVGISLNFGFAPLSYALFPVSGPQFAFANFPQIPAMIAPHIIRLTAAPNGMPSLHLSTALLICWYARRWRWGYVAAIVHLLLVVITTLASGQHYLFDLVAAVPYSVAVIVGAKAFRGLWVGERHAVQQHSSV